MKMKDEAAFNNVTWSDNKLSFELSSALKHSNKLTFMVPETYGTKRIKGITNNGKTQSFIQRIVKGSNYAFVSVEPGKSYNLTVSY